MNECSNNFDFRSVDMVLIKIKLLLQNGTTYIQDSLAELQGMLELMKRHTGEQVVIKRNLINGYYFIRYPFPKVSSHDSKPNVI